MNTSTPWPTIDKHLQRTFTFTSYQAGVEFVVDIAQIAEDMDHHPDIELLWRKVKVSIRTHSKDAITELDYTFRDRCNRVYSSKKLS